MQAVVIGSAAGNLATRGDLDAGHLGADKRGSQQDGHDYGRGHMLQTSIHHRLAFIRFHGGADYVTGYRGGTPI